MDCKENVSKVQRVAMVGSSVKAEETKTVDKTCLSEALNFQTQDCSVDFAWVQHLPLDILLSSSICFEDCHIQIPVSLQDFEKIKLMTKDTLLGGMTEMRKDRACHSNTPMSKMVKEMKCSNGFPSLPFRNLDLLTSQILDHFEIPPEFTCYLKLEPNKLALCEVGSHNAEVPSSHHVVDDILGTIILQLPVEGGYEGGNLHVQYKEKEKSFDLHQDSEKNISVTVIIGCCDVRTEPIKKGFKLTYVYDLIWIGSEEKKIPQDLPIFLHALKGVKASLNSWIPPASAVEWNLESIGLGKIMKQRATLKFKNREVEGQRVANKKIVEFQMGWEGKLFYFTLDGLYDRNLSFRHLQGTDKMMARVFQNCPFLDVALAVVLHQVIKAEHTKTCSSSESEEPYRRCAYYVPVDRGPKTLATGIQRTEIIRLVDFSGKPVNLSLELDWKEHHSGCGRNLLDIKRTAPFSQKQSYNIRNCLDSDLTLKESTFYHPILVIWPKHESFAMNCRYGLSAYLDHIENVYKPPSSSTEKNEFPKFLNIVVAQWNDQISRVKNNSSLMSTIRLLRFCTKYLARGEGLTVIKMFHQLKDCENIRLFIDHICQATIEFVSIVCRDDGWKSCFPLIEQLIRSVQVSDSLLPFTKSATCFLKAHCIDGARVIADHLSSELIRMNHGNIDILKVADVMGYLKLVLSLEEDSRTRSEDRLKSVATLFLRLKPSVQCSIVLQLDNDQDTRRKMPIHHKVLFDSLCAVLSCCKVYSEPVATKTIIKILQLYIRLENREWLQVFISSMTQVPKVDPGSSSNSSYDSDTEYSLIERQNISIQKISETPAILELAKSSDIARKLVLIPLKHQAFGIENHSVGSYFRNVLEMECPPHLPYDPYGIEVLEFKLEKLKTTTLSEVFIEVIKFNKQRLIDYPKVLAIVQRTFHIFLNRVNKEETLPDVIQVLKLVASFLTITAVDEVTKLLETICARAVALVQSTAVEGEILIYFVSLVGTSTLAYFKSPNHVSLIMNTCRTLIELSMTRQISLASDAKNLEGNQQTQLVQTIVQCVSLFFLAKTNSSGDCLKNFSPSLQNLFVQLPLDVMMQVILELHEKATCSDANTTKLPVCREWIANVFKACMKQDFVSTLITKNTSNANKIVECLLWLGDDEAWRCFSASICQSEKFVAVAYPFGTILPRHHSGVMTRIANTPAAMEAFIKIGAHAQSKSKLVVEPAFNWKQPLASVPNYPQVQSFLRSDVESCAFKIFTSISDARRFANYLGSIQSSNNFGVTVKTLGVGKNATCLIVKERQYQKNHALKQSILARLASLKSLSLLASKLKDLRLASLTNLNRNAPSILSAVNVANHLDVAGVLPPAKRVKPNVSTVTI